MKTLCCQYCNKLFKGKNICFCSKSCEKKAAKLPGIAKCLICKKEFKNYGCQITCSPTCNQSYLEQFKLTTNNEVKKKCANCGKKFTHSSLAGQEKSFCSLSCSHPELQINDCLKNKKTTDFWGILETALKSDSVVVSKTWGAEVHIINHKKYCLKYLFFFKGCNFSNHYHKLKQEAWHCLLGKFEILLTDKKKNKELLVLNQGDKIELPPYLIHQVLALENSVLVEVSTQSFNEDSYRITSEL